MAETRSNTEEQIRLWGRIFLEMDIRAVTGLHIGGTPAALAIGEVDNPIIRDPLTEKPYIPGSSLRGKMRSLWEKATNAPQNQRVGQATIHSMGKGTNRVDFMEDSVCRIFGASGDAKVTNPTRLIVHDCFLGDASATQLERANTTLYAETKWEATIDRITSAAVPRQMERVPAGAVFEGCRLVYNLFELTHREYEIDEDTIVYTSDFLPIFEDSRIHEINWFLDIIEMLDLVQDEYLGGSGSRGSGQIKFQKIRLSAKRVSDVEGSVRYEPVTLSQGTFSTIEDMKTNRENIGHDLHNQLR